MNKELHIKTLLALAIFFVSVAAYYYPVQQKGYAPGADHQNLMEARNFAVSGTYEIENSKSILLSSGHVEQYGIEKGIFNPLTPIIYGRIFKYFGFEENLALYVSIVLFSLFNVLIFYLSTRLFGIAAGFLAGISCAFLPVMAVGAIHGGFYEWALLFFGVALWLYLGSRTGPFRAGPLRVFAASVFFALAALSRNAFAISFVPFLFYDFFIHRSYKRSLIFLLPFIVLFGPTLTPYSWLGVPNGYTATIENMPFDLIGHFFRDPYSFHYDKENYIKEMLEKGLNRTGVLFAADWGYNVSWSEKINAHFDSLKFYIGQIFDLTVTGGPAVLGLMILGLAHLWRANKKLLGLFALWSVIWLGYLVYDRTGNWDHLMEISFVFAVLTGLGIYSLIGMISGEKHKKAVALIFLIFFAGHMAYASKWKMHDIYRSSKENIVIDLKNKIEESSDSKGVYAIGIHPSSVYSFNYRLDRDAVYFDHQTIEDLLESKKLKEAFAIYNIGTVVGYSDELTDRILSQASVKAIR